MRYYKQNEIENENENITHNGKKVKRRQCKIIYKQKQRKKNNDDDEIGIDLILNIKYFIFS